ncbi:MAG: CRISPR-associated protein Cas4, partial [Anaerolineae bacterium]|nr:CRISPR-associated protein Cas4 [Anaerolineae bacterium]
VATDARGWRRPAQPYFSPTWGLAGRPDYVLKHRGRSIPVEVKSGRTPEEPYEGHILQLGAYCLLLEEAEGRPPPYGLIRYPEATFRVPFDRHLRQRVVQALETMRAAEEEGGIARGHREPWRCRACGYRDACDQRLGE